MKYIGFMVCEGVTKNRTTNLVSPKARVYTSQPLKSLPRSAHNPPTSSSGNTKSIPRPSEKTWTQETSSSQLSRPVLPSMPHQSSLPLENSKFLPYRSLSLSLSLSLCVIFIFLYVYVSLCVCIWQMGIMKWEGNIIERNQRKLKRMGNSKPHFVYPSLAFYSFLLLSFFLSFGCFASSSHRSLELSSGHVVLSRSVWARVSLRAWMRATLQKDRHVGYLSHIVIVTRSVHVAVIWRVHVVLLFD